MGINKEELALELMVTILQTGKPSIVLERAIEELNKAGEKKVAEKLGEVHRYVESGYDMVESFYYGGFLKDETYNYLQLVNQKGVLNETFVKNFLEEYRYKKKIMKQLYSAFVSPIAYMFLSAVMGVFITKQFITLINTSTTGEYPAWMSIHLFIANHPVISFFLILIFSVMFSLGVLIALFRKIGYKEMKLYFLSSLLSTLRTQGISYAEIFESLRLIEKSKKWKDLFEYIAVESKYMKISDAIRPLYELLPVNLSILLQNYLEKSADVEGWKMVRDEIKDIFKSKIEAFSSIAPMLGYLIVAFIIIFSMLPLKVAISQLIKSISGGM